MKSEKLARVINENNNRKIAELNRELLVKQELIEKEKLEKLEIKIKLENEKQDQYLRSQDKNYRQ